MSWETKRLSEVADFRLGKMLDQRKNKGDLLPYLANKNVRWGEFDLSEMREMRFEERELETFSLKNGDIVMCEGGVPGRCAIWRDQLPKMMYQKALHRIRPFETMNEVYLYYNLSHRAKSGHFEGLFTGSTIKHLPKEKLALVEVDVPDLPTQERIAFILSAYDDLIENNRRRIALLEQAARLLYREWFVHFRFPGHKIAKFVDGLPEGWRTTTILDHCPLVYGKALRADTRVNGDIDVFGSSGIVGSHNKRLVERNSIIVGRKGNVGSIFWAERDFWPIDTVYYIAPKNSDYFTYYAMQNVTFINTDVAVPGLNRDFAHSRELRIPDDELLADFNQKAEAFKNNVAVLTKQSSQLTAARDLLLPRLMDGRLPV
jgi:type I restriction enzyme S subunit